MKIVHLVESFAYGTAKSVRQLSQYFREQHQVSVYYGHRQGTDLDLEGLCDGIRLVALPGSGPLRHLQNIAFLKRDLPVDTGVIHGHSAYGGMYAKAISNSRDASVLYSPRGYSFLREDYGFLLRSAFRAMERLTSGRCVTVACGRHESNLARKLGGPVVQINNGFHVSDPLPIDSLDNTVIGCGRICYQKGYDRFLEVANKLPHLKFVWVGAADPGEKFLSLPIPPNVHFVDYVQHDVLLDMIQRCRCVFLPSRWEGLSRFLIESVCLGKAIVTSRFPANMDCLDRGIPDRGSPSVSKQDQNEFKNGFASDDCNDLVDAIAKLSIDDLFLHEMQHASHSFAKREFDMQRILQRWNNLYGLMNHSPPQPSTGESFIRINAAENPSIPSPAAHETAMPSAITQNG